MLVLLAATAAPAQQIATYVARSDMAGEGARVAAAAAGAPHVAEWFGVSPLAEVGSAAVEAPGSVAALAAWNEAGRQPLQNGFARPLPVPRQVSLTVGPASQPVVARDGGVLAQTSDSTFAWGGTVRVRGAFRLRLHLSRVRLPAGARLWVHGAGQTVGPFGEELLAPDRSLWTPSVPGEEVALDVELPAAATLASAGRHGFTIDAALEIVPPESVAKDTSCEVDTSCVGTANFPGFDAARHAVALLEFVQDFLGFACTGQLLNDAASDGTPYLLTAHHCISTPAAAASLQARFDDYTPSCNATPPALNTLPTVNGSTLLVTGRADSAPDFTLLRLSSLPGGRTFLGWDATPGAAADGTALYRVSHAAAGAQRYSVTTADSRSAQCTEDNLPLSRFIYSDLGVGAASPGSSGAAAMLADGRVVGQLFGGCGGNVDPCSSATKVVDGRISSSFDQLQPFLSPGSVIGGCAPGDTRLCLGRGRFQVQATWSNQFNGTAGVARALVGTDNAGFFFFTDPSNYELVVKILDFGSVWKVFYAELTNLKFIITVADTRTGLVKTYKNTPGDCGAIDQAAFPAGAPGEVVAAAAPQPMVPLGAAAPPPTTLAASEPKSSCGGGLCLASGRFAVSLHWRNQFSGASGDGRPRALSDTSGLFTFTDPSNVEVVLKVVLFSTKVAFFYSALSDLEYDITVADLAGGSVKIYHNAAGSYCGGIDDQAFPP